MWWPRKLHLKPVVQGWLEPYIYRYVRCTYGIFSREITILALIYGADVRLWPTLLLLYDCKHLHTYAHSFIPVLCQHGLLYGTVLWSRTVFIQLLDNNHGKLRYNVQYGAKGWKLAFCFIKGSFWLLSPQILLT